MKKNETNISNKNYYYFLKFKITILRYLLKFTNDNEIESRYIIKYIFI